MTVDQGGKGGMLVDFFGRSASMPTGAVKLAMKYGSPVIPVFFCREKGPYIKAWAGAEIAITRSGRQEEDLRDNLRRIITVFEDFISKHPKEYLWTYKIWKYSDARRVLILSDGKAGHLRQSEAALGITQSVLKEKGINSRVDTVEVKFKNSLSRFIFNICVLFSGKYSCQDCLWCFKHSLSKETLSALIKASPDIIISAGSSLAGINCLLSRLNLSKSIVLMRPGLLGVRRFSLAVIPKHDRPSKRKNTVALSAALNLIDKAYLKEQSDKLCALQGLDNGALYIGILIGGNSRRFILTPESVKGILKEAVLLSKALGAGLLITTSRRTPLQVDRLVKINTKDCPQVKLAVIANENNIPEAVGGILGLSSIVIVTPESISMISEAVNSGKYVFVVEGPGLSRKHRRFIRGLSGAKFIYPVKTEELNSKVLETWNKKPPGPALDDNNLVAQALRRVL
jgi:mitochondrial fission protein ELM1